MEHLRGLGAGCGRSEPLPLQVQQLLVQRIEVARQRIVLMAAAGTVVAVALAAALALLWRQLP